ncbi:MAG: PHP domain-containing protein [Candidatus Merdivicinus sp.]|jgi:hypothetical protein
MENHIFLDENCKKYKGNIHTHSTRSDGVYSPEELVKAYRERGYDFLCLSDHEIYYKSSQFDTDDFIVLDGYEMACDTDGSSRDASFHIHGLLDTSLHTSNPFAHDEKHPKPYYHSLDTVQDLMDEMIERGNWIVWNHPNWSKNTYEEILQLKGYGAVEIYNHQSQIEEACGYSISYWDYLLQHGKKVWGIAADDAHSGDYRDVCSEFFGGFIVVQAEKLQQQSMIEAIKNGKFYSSSGPQIHDIRVENGIVKVKCSEVKSIQFVTFPHSGKTVYSRDGSLIQEGNYQIKGTEKYIRIECVDPCGNIAWSNPIWFNE